MMMSVAQPWASHASTLTCPQSNPYYRVSWENPQMVTRYQRILEDPLSLRAFTEELKKIILRSRRASPDLCGARWQQS